eukprot:jgi/Bigna1/72926/fgenesh1_pg.22_\
MENLPTPLKVHSFREKGEVKVNKTDELVKKGPDGQIHSAVSSTISHINIGNALRRLDEINGLSIPKPNFLGTVAKPTEEVTASSSIGHREGRIKFPTQYRNNDESRAGILNIPSSLFREPRQRQEHGQGEKGLSSLQVVEQQHQQHAEGLKNDLHSVFSLLRDVDTLLAAKKSVQNQPQTEVGMGVGAGADMKHRKRNVGGNRSNGEHVLAARKSSAMMPKQNLSNKDTSTRRHIQQYKQQSSRDSSPLSSLMNMVRRLGENGKEGVGSNQKPFQVLSEKNKALIITQQKSNSNSKPRPRSPPSRVVKRGGRILEERGGDRRRGARKKDRGSRAIRLLADDDNDDDEYAAAGGAAGGGGENHDYHQGTDGVGDGEEKLSRRRRRQGGKFRLSTRELCRVDRILDNWSNRRAAAAAAAAAATTGRERKAIIGLVKPSLERRASTSTSAWNTSTTMKKMRGLVATSTTTSSQQQHRNEPSSDRLRMFSSIRERLQTAMAAHVQEGVILKKRHLELHVRQKEIIGITTTSSSSSSTSNNNKSAGRSTTAGLVAMYKRQLSNSATQQGNGGHGNRRIKHLSSGSGAVASTRNASSSRRDKRGRVRRSREANSSSSSSSRNNGLAQRRVEMIQELCRKVGMKRGVHAFRGRVLRFRALRLLVEAAYEQERGAQAKDCLHRWLVVRMLHNDEIRECASVIPGMADVLLFCIICLTPVGVNRYKAWRKWCRADNVARQFHLRSRSEHAARVLSSWRKDAVRLRGMRASCDEFLRQKNHCVMLRALRTMRHEAKGARIARALRLQTLTERYYGYWRDNLQRRIVRQRQREAVGRVISIRLHIICSNALRVWGEKACQIRGKAQKRLLRRVFRRAEIRWRELQSSAAQSMMIIRSRGEDDDDYYDTEKWRGQEDWSFHNTLATLSTMQTAGISSDFGLKLAADFSLLLRSLSKWRRWALNCRDKEREDDLNKVARVFAEASLLSRWFQMWRESLHARSCIKDIGKS